MNELLKNEIQAFVDLQKKYSDCGAEDSEPDYIFQLVIARALSGDTTGLDIDRDIDWDLYEPNADEAILELSQQAWKIYKLIQATASIEDRAELKKYCWRLDEAEFE